MSAASSVREYEFSQEQNTLFSALAGRMRGVGLFLIVLALLNLLVAALVVVAIYRARLPQSYVDTVLEKASEATRTDVKGQLSNLPPDNHLWGIAICAGINGLLYLLMGVWTRSSAASFQQVVDTTGRDIRHLMDALSELNKMYSLIYTLIVIGLLVLIAALGLVIYAQMTR
jgi:hypothetical protein